MTLKRPPKGYIWERIRGKNKALLWHKLFVGQEAKFKMTMFQCQTRFLLRQNGHIHCIIWTHTKWFSEYNKLIVEGELPLAMNMRLNDPPVLHLPPSCQQSAELAQSQQQVGEWHRSCCRAPVQNLGWSLQLIRQNAIFLQWCSSKGKNVRNLVLPVIFPHSYQLKACGCLFSLLFDNTNN